MYIKELTQERNPTHAMNVENPPIEGLVIICIRENVPEKILTAPANMAEHLVTAHHIHNMKDAYWRETAQM